MACPNCATEPLSSEALFCTRCGAPLAKMSKAAAVGRAILLPLALLGSALAWPIRKRRERIRRLTEAATPGRLSTLFRG